jgi:hypothetical protein
MPMPMPKPNIVPDAGAQPTEPAKSGTSASKPPGQRLTTASCAVFIESPARMLHDQLASRLAVDHAVADTRWPGAARVGIILGGSLALWGAIIASVGALTA